MDGVPYPQPLARPEPQYVPWGVLLVRPIGHPPRPVPPRTADQQSRAYPTLLRVLRWGRYGHRGGPQTPEGGSLACVSRGPFSSRPPFRCVVSLVSRLSGVGWWWWGGGGVPAVPGRVACVRVASSSGCGSLSVCLFVARCVRAWCLCWCVVCGLWCVVCGGGVSVGLWLLCGVVGPSPLLAEVPVCYYPPLLAGFPTHAHSSAQDRRPAQGQWWQRWTDTQLWELRKWAPGEPSLEGLVHQPRKGSVENCRLRPAGGWMPQAAWEAILADALHHLGVNPHNLPAPQDHPYVLRRLRETLQERQQDGIRLWDITQSPAPHKQTPSPPHKRRRTDTGGGHSTPEALRTAQHDASDPPASGAAT